MNQELQIKYCPQCQSTKPINAFRTRKFKSGNVGLCGWCQSCNKQYNQKYNQNLSITQRRLHNQQIRTYYQNNPTKLTQRNHRYNSTHQKQRRETHVAYLPRLNQLQKERRKTDPNFKRLTNLRTRINQARHNHSKYGTAIKLLGHSILDDNHYIESLWYNNMSWDTWGLGLGKWQIHHICPLEFFDMSNPIEQQQAFHYTNTKPLWYDDHVEEHRQIDERMKTH